MKKTFVKLIAGAVMVTAIGCATSVGGTSAMMASNNTEEIMKFIAQLPKFDKRGRRLEYTVSRDGTISVTPWNIDGTPCAPKIIRR